MNTVQLIGRMVADPELSKTSTGRSVCKFRIAVNRLRKEDPADFISCVAWNQTAEAIERYTGKGLRVAIQGSIQTGSYDSKHGQKVYTTDVLVNRIDFLDYRNSAVRQAQQPDYSDPGYSQGMANSAAGDDFKLDIESDDLPF